MAVTQIVPVSKGVKDIERHSFALAADLGQSADPTAIAVVEHTRTERLHWKGHALEKPTDRFDVRHLERLPLGVSYVQQVQHIAMLLSRPPLNTGCEFIVDESGVGRAVADLASHLNPIRVTIVGGENQTAQGPRRWHVPKSVLISILDARLHTGEVRFAAELSEASAMAEELKNFRRSVSAAGFYSYQARASKHDDLVLAVSLGLWSFVGRAKVEPTQVTRASFTKPTTRATYYPKKGVT